METIKVLLVLVGVLALKFSISHAGNNHEKLASIRVTIGENLKPKVTPVDGSMITVVGEPRGEIVEEERNGVKFQTLRTSVTVIIRSPTHSEAYIPENGFGFYKFNSNHLVRTVEDVCEADEATIAYPLYLEEADLMARYGVNKSAVYLAVGLEKNDYGIFNIKNDNEVPIPLSFWDSDAETGNCIALKVSSARLVNISCDQALPFLCKKGDGYETGFGFYKHHPELPIDEMEDECGVIDSSVAYPKSLHEAKIIASRAMDEERYLSVGLRKDAGKYVHVSSEDDYVNIENELWDEDEPSGRGNCIALNVGTKKLMDINCGGELPFICKKPLDLQPSVTLSNGLTYQYYPDYTAADKVKRACTRDGYDSAAYPKGKSFNELAVEMAALIPEEDPYVTTGIKRIRRGRSSYSYQEFNSRHTLNLQHYWADGEPSGSGDCVKFSKETRKFHMYNCDELLPYLCVRF